MLNNKILQDRDKLIKKIIDDTIYFAQMEVIDIDTDDYSVTLKYGEKYFKKASLRGINLKKTDNDIYDVEIPEKNSKVWCLVTQNQAIVIKNYRSEKLITKINNTEIHIQSDKIEIKSDKIYINCTDENEPVVKGKTLKSLLTKILNWIKNHGHFATAIGAPTTTTLSTPSMASLLAEIETEIFNLDNINSTKNFGG